MQKFFLSICLMLFSVTLFATELEVEIKDIESENVNLYITICNEESFNSKNPQKDCYIGQMAKITNEKNYTFKFDNVPEGQWAIFGYIDENMNRQLDKTFIGIPKEQVMFTVILKGPPSFKKIMSEIKGDKQKIELIVQ